MSEGTVRWFNYKKGYGFLYSDEFKSDIFLHHSEFLKKEYIHEGSSVTFEAIEGQHGLKAKDVSLR